MTVDIEGASALVDWAIDMNGVINLNKQTMSFEGKSLCIVVPLNPAKGPGYTELVYDYEEGDYDLDQIYEITMQDQV